MKLLLIIFVFGVSPFSYSQSVIEGDQLLQLIGMPVSDPLFTQLKTQESFLTDAWDKNFTVYISRIGDIITEIDIQNGKQRYGSKDRYGYYKRLLPLGLDWTMRTEDFEKKLGTPVLKNSTMNFHDHQSGNLQIRVYYENDTPVSITLSKLRNYTTTSPKPVIKNHTPVNATPVPVMVSPSDWVIKTDTTTLTTQVNWAALRQLIISTNNLQAFTSKDSVDYIGQMYYGTPYKSVGFERTAIKRLKKTNRWHYEAFISMTTADTMKVSGIFLSMYQALKKTIKDSTGDDFILASVAKDPLSVSPMNWMAQWTLYSNYKGLVPGLNKVKIAILLSGTKAFMEKGKLRYTIKFYVLDKDTPVDFFTWNTPQN